MNIINSTKLRSNLADALKMAKKKDFVLISHRGKIKTAIVDIDMLEDLLELGDKEYLKSIKEAREQYKRGEYYTFEEVFGNI
jgi:PHD/YefM family antitoxin component YafN of YafNO toxin-antitoxin module